MRRLLITLLATLALLTSAAAVLLSSSSAVARVSCPRSFDTVAAEQSSGYYTLADGRTELQWGNDRLRYFVKRHSQLDVCLIKRRGDVTFATVITIDDRRGYIGVRANTHIVGVGWQLDWPDEPRILPTRTINR